MRWCLGPRRVSEKCKEITEFTTEERSRIEWETHGEDFEAGRTPACGPA
jgi:hypothetical protein